MVAGDATDGSYPTAEVFACERHIAGFQYSSVLILVVRFSPDFVCFSRISAPVGGYVQSQQQATGRVVARYHVEVYGGGFWGAVFAGCAGG